MSHPLSVEKPLTVDEAIAELEFTIKKTARHIRIGNRVGRNMRTKASAERLLAALNEVKQLPRLTEEIKCENH